MKNSILPEQVFLSGPPKVKLINSFSRSYENAVATARTCYSPRGIILTEDVSGDAELDPEKKKQKEERRDSLAKSIYHAGHHTTLQHGHFQFALENVSRHFIWSFLHAHPFYNSEQVSQRYVEVKSGAYVVPPIDGEALDLYQKIMIRQTEDYHKLIEILYKPTQAEYNRVWPARKNNPKYDKDIKKKTQEIARYVLPIGTTAYLYHTISGLTLLRYWRIANILDTNLETRLVIKKMVEELLAIDPHYNAILEEPIPLEETPEWHYYTENLTNIQPEAFRQEFDVSLQGRISRLVDYKNNHETILAQSVREVLGLTRCQMRDEEALQCVLNPAHNKILGETMNLTTLSKLSRCLVHASYTFRKILSHTADSQDQRHRMTPASRPILLAHTSNEPDYITPMLIQSDEQAKKVYKESLEKTWSDFAELTKMGISKDFAMYVLPNALAVRFTESTDLLNLHHKLKMRLCYNAQEEIWQASVQEAQQISWINPTIGKYLLPPCGLRKLSHSSPICPEGDRYCGVPVWRLERHQYKRLI